MIMMMMMMMMVVVVVVDLTVMIIHDYVIQLIIFNISINIIIEKVKPNDVPFHQTI